MSPTPMQEKAPARRSTTAMQGLSVRTRRLGAVLVLLVAILLGVAVIPPVLRDTFATTPQTAAAAFGVVALLLAVVGIAALAVSPAPAVGPFMPPSLLPTIGGGVLTVLLGLVLIDAAASFGGHGPAMRGVTITLWGCVALAVTAGAFLIISGVTSRR